ncbi:MAG: hypothetical protein Q4A62_10925, partial [Eikenella sp.]|nr:hypothetical protein [Eikenella sp.]
MMPHIGKRAEQSECLVRADIKNPAFIRQDLQQCCTVCNEFKNDLSQKTRRFIALGFTIDTHADKFDRLRTVNREGNVLFDSAGGDNLKDAFTALTQGQGNEVGRLRPLPQSPKSPKFPPKTFRGFFMSTF